MQIEHLGLNVKNPAEMADWYVAHLGMRIVRGCDEPAVCRFVADSADHVMLEIYYNPDADTPDYSTLDPLVAHLAFASDDVEADHARLLAAGATTATAPTPLDNGDTIAILRDPWGFPIQLCHRAEPML